MKVFERPDHPNNPQLAHNPSLVCPRFSPLPPQSGTLMIKHGNQDIRIPNVINQALQRSPLAQSLQCKEIQDLCMADARLRGMTNRGRYFGSRPNHGNMRNDPVGLASHVQHPTQSQLFPKADSFFAGLPNKLGQPK